MNIKGLCIKASFRGNNVVNSADEKEKNYRRGQRWDIKNVKLAKTALSYIDQDGEFNENVERKVKISSNLLRNVLFEDQVPYQTSAIFAGLKSYSHVLIANYSSLLRGYLLADLGLKRKSPLMVTDAIQTNNSVLKLEVQSTSGMRGETSFYHKEQVGDIEYEATLALDLSDLAFVSCDIIADRCAFDPDDWDNYKMILKESFPNIELPDELAYYKKSTSELPLGENGYIMTNEMIFECVKRLLTKLANFEIKKATGYARIDELEVYLIEDGKPFFSTESDAFHIRYGGEGLDKLLENVRNSDYVVNYRKVADSDLEFNQKFREEFASKMEANKSKEKKVKKKKASTRKTEG